MDEDMDVKDLGGLGGDMGGDFGGAGGFDASEFTPQAVGEEKDVSPAKDGGVMKKLLVAGEGYKKPEKGDSVTGACVHYVGTLLDGTPFDSSRERGEPFVFNLGVGAVIKGWDAGVASMLLNEKCILTCAPGYAYGERGSPPKIPANSTLQFEVELLSWKSVKEVTPDGGVIKTVLVEGTGWETVGPNDGAVVSYTATPAGEGAAPLAAVARATFECVADAPPGLAAALKAMKKGEEASVEVKNVAVGAAGGAPGVDYTAGLGLPAGCEAATVALTLHEVQKVEAVPGSGPPPGATRKVLAAGEGYDRPNEGAAVTLRVEGRLDAPGGDVFLPATEMTATADDGVLPLGLDKALLGMAAGETALVRCPASAAFGAAGAPAGGPHTPAAAVPPGAAVAFTVTLLSFVREKESWDLAGDADKLAWAEAKKAEANPLFASGEPARAARRYARALKMVEHDSGFTTDDGKRAAKALRAVLHSNAAACALKAGDAATARSAASKALDLDPGAGKARFRLATALVALGEHHDAVAQLRRLLEAEPANAGAARLLAVAKRGAAEADKKEAGLWARAFAPQPSASAKAPKKAAAAQPQPVEADAAADAAAAAALEAGAGGEPAAAGAGAAGAAAGGEAAPPPAPAPMETA